jgi:hypothetical protein
MDLMEANNNTLCNAANPQQARIEISARIAQMV